jgi:ribonuclease HI/retron-type reverse transcriptase
MLENQLFTMLITPSTNLQMSVNNQINGLEQVIFKQINLQKSQTAMASLCDSMIKWSCSPLFVFLQEPATPGGKTGPVPRGTQVFATTDYPRAAILATPEMKIWPMAEFTSRDVVACIWKSESEDFPEIVLISVYADGTTATISQELSKVTQYCYDMHLPTILCCDTNAHSTIWGCPENNSRGDDFEEYIAANSLSVLNTGSVPTFQTVRAESIIDVSLVHYHLYDLVTDWRVSEEELFSDHKCIEFKLKISQPPPSLVKNWRRTDWVQFESSVTSKGAKWVAPTEWTRATLDTEVEKLNAELTSALNHCTPSFIPRKRLRKNTWWTQELTEARKALRVSYRKWLCTKADEDHQLHRVARNYMKHAIKSAKVISWQNFCSDAGSGEEGSSRDLARLHKILQRNKNQTLGLLRRNDGEMASSPEESIDTLLDEHFPDSVPTNDNDLLDPYMGMSSSLTNWGQYPWLSDVKIREAVGRFSPYKTAGLDGFKPVVLQHLPLTCITRLGVLFKASLELAYVPQHWRSSRVIFIPKAGKKDYAHVRSWRPISLMSFMFKTLERLLLWHLEETIFQEKPMHKNQHAFRKGRSTESALSDTVDFLEHAVLQKGVAISVFLDIEGAFDNLLPEGIIRSLRTRKTPENILMWLHKYLLSRRAVVEHRGVNKTRRLVKGTPQGGVLSPVLWNLAFDEVLVLLDDSAIKACGYADDLVLIGRGPDPLITCNNMQQALNKVANWGLEQGLRFSASKSVAIAFTRKLKWESIPLKLNNTTLEWQTQVKYLGVVLDQRLLWTIHVRERITKAIGLLFKYKQIVGTEFGPQPKYMRWMYTSIIRPAIIYGAVVWWRIASDAVRMTKFTKIARLALLTFGAVRKSTPTVGMEVIGYLPPMDLFLEGEVVKAWLRIKDIRKEMWDGLGLVKTIGHRRALQKLTKTFPIPERIWDVMPELVKRDRMFQVDTNFQHGIPTYSTVKCFTSGVTLQSKAGAGYFITVNGDIARQKSAPLGSYATTYQAELTAILWAAEALRPYVLEGQITIFSGSQSAIKALNNPNITSKLVLTTNVELDILAHASTYPVKLAWVNAHDGHRTNALANSLAEKGTKLTLTEAEPVVPVCKSQITKDINLEVERRWNRRWTKTVTARQSRALWPTVNKNKSSQAMFCNRQEYAELVRMLTGHNNLNRHSSLCKEVESAECRFCRDEEETALHLLCDCPALKGQRFRVLGFDQADARVIGTVPLDGVRRFISLIRRALNDEGLEKI